MLIHMRSCVLMCQCFVLCAEKMYCSSQLHCPAALWTCLLDMCEKTFCECVCTKHWQIALVGGWSAINPCDGQGHKLPLSRSLLFSPTPLLIHMPMAIYRNSYWWLVLAILNGNQSRDDVHHDVCFQLFLHVNVKSTTGWVYYSWLHHFCCVFLVWLL